MIYVGQIYVAIAFLVRCNGPLFAGNGSLDQFRDLLCEFVSIPARYCASLSPSRPTNVRKVGREHNPITIHEAHFLVRLTYKPKNLSALQFFGVVHRRPHL
jgi:hypothetical protein